MYRQIAKYSIGYSIRYSTTYFWFQNGFTNINEPDYDKSAKSKKATYMRYSFVWPVFSPIIAHDFFYKTGNYMNKLLKPK
jgi:hypothetical protein